MSSVSCRVVNIDSLFRFHIQPEATFTFVDSPLPGEINRNDAVLPSQALPGFPCLAEFDSVLYRAKVLAKKYISGKNLVTVFFVDYGNTEILSLDSRPPKVIHIPSACLQFEPCAFQCSLGFKNFNQNNLSIKEKLTDKFCNLVQEGEQSIRLKIVRQHQSGSRINLIADVLYGGESAVNTLKETNARLSKERDTKDPEIQKSSSPISAGSRPTKTLSTGSHNPNPVHPNPAAPPGLPRSLPPDNSIVRILYSLGPQCMYLRVEDDNDKLEEFVVEMTRFYNRRKEIHENRYTKDSKFFKLQVGDVIAVFCGKNEKWFRAKVCKRLANKFEMMLIDLGRFETMSLNHDSVKELLGKFQKQAAFAIPCCLREIFHKSVVVENLSQFHLKEIRVCSVNMRKIGTRHVIDLFSEGRNIGELMTSGQALRPDEICETDKSRATSDADTITNDRLNSSCAASTSLPESRGSMPRNNVNTAEFMRHFIIKFSGCQDLSEALSEFSSFNMPTLNGPEVINSITHVDPPERFYVALERHVKERQAIENVLIHAESFPTLTEFKIGDLCCSKYSVDDLWYRAVVFSRRSTAGIGVFFLDFGNHEVVPNKPSHVRVLPFALETLPALAYTCRLKENSSDDSETMLQFIGSVEKSSRVNFVSSFTQLLFEQFTEVHEVELC